MRPALSAQFELTPHCQEPPPILGPLPKSGGGMSDVVADLA